MHKLFIIIALSVTGSFAQVLNEICPSNTAANADFFSGYLDWIEIYNSTDDVLHLDGYTLTNDYTNPSKWSFPPIVLPSSSFLTLNASDEIGHISRIDFAFPKEGGTIYLFDPSAELVDSIAYPAMHTDHSYGRIGSNYYYFDDPTPGDPNNTAIGYNGYANPPQINLTSGRYNSGIEIAATAVLPSETIYYSTNGTYPTDAFMYDGPVTVSRSVTFRFLAEADSLIDSYSVYRTYFVDHHHNLPIVNLSVDSLELFDMETGLFMMGPDAVPTPPHLGANFWEDREVPVYFEYFDSSFNALDAMNCHLKTFGGIGSRWRAMKSIQLRGKKTYEKKYFTYPYFENKDIEAFRRLVLRNGGNDFCNSSMKDAALHNYFIQCGLNVDLLAYNPVVVYINGYYWGLQNMREKADRYYVESNYGLDPETVNLLGQASLDEVEGSDSAFVAIMEYVDEHDLADAIHYDWIGNRLDLNSFVDYFLIQLYVNNRDWPNFNLKVWNAEGHEKWRYICYDMDVGLKYNGDGKIEHQSLAFILSELAESNPHVLLLDALLDNAEFRRYFINRYCDLLNTVLDKDEIFKGIIAQKAKVENEMVAHYTKWCGNIDDWHERFNGQKGFIDGREFVIHEELAQVFDLPDAVNITVDVYPLGAAKVRLNTLQLTDFPFEGSYFGTNKIDLSAEINIGQIFKHWKNVKTGEIKTSQTIQVDPQDEDHWVVICQSHDLFELSLVPNPAQNLVLLRFIMTAKSEVVVRITDMNGRVVKQINYPDEYLIGRHEIAINIDNLLPGQYMLFLATDYGQEVEQFIKL